MRRPGPALFVDFHPLACYYGSHAVERFLFRYGQDIHQSARAEKTKVLHSHRAALFPLRAQARFYEGFRALPHLL